jgi:hypothetical protein
MTTLMYKPLSFLSTALGGLVAGAAFGKLWKVLAREDEKPKPTDERRSWREVLLAASLEGAVFGLVRAVTSRLSAAGVARATGSWPDS